MIRYRMKQPSENNHMLLMIWKGLSANIRVFGETTNFLGVFLILALSSSPDTHIVHLLAIFAHLQQVIGKHYPLGLHHNYKNHAAFFHG